MKTKIINYIKQCLEVILVFMVHLPKMSPLVVEINSFVKEIFKAIEFLLDIIKFY